MLHYIRIQPIKKERFCVQVHSDDPDPRGRSSSDNFTVAGYVTSRVAASGSRLVQAAIAVAPVTSFRFYDTIYTERYMSLPKYNPVSEISVNTSHATYLDSCSVDAHVDAHFDVDVNVDVDGNVNADVDGNIDVDVDVDVYGNVDVN